MSLHLQQLLLIVFEFAFGFKLNYMSNYTRVSVIAIYLHQLVINKNSTGATLTSVKRTKTFRNNIIKTFRSKT